MEAVPDNEQNWDVFIGDTPVKAKTSTPVTGDFRTGAEYANCDAHVVHTCTRTRTRTRLPDRAPSYACDPSIDRSPAGHLPPTKHLLSTNRISKPINNQPTNQPVANKPVLERLAGAAGTGFSRSLCLGWFVWFPPPLTVVFPRTCACVRACPALYVCAGTSHDASIVFHEQI